MYIPASSFMPRSTPLTGRCSPATTSTVTVDGTLKHPLSLRLQSPARRAQQIRKAQTPTVVVNNSGEIVRPCLRAPTTPLSQRTPRFVHFGADLECVRWFLKAQSPRSVSQDAEPEVASSLSAAEAERTSTVRLTGIRRPAPSYAVYEASAVVLERVELASTQRSAAMLRGTVKVHNVAFEKSVVVRYSFDQWKSAHEAVAHYSRTLLDAQAGRPGVDRFVFTLPLPADVTATLPAMVALCARYTVAGAEHWDNNKGANYLFRLALPAAPAIADDDYDCDAVVTRTHTSELCAPRRLTFNSNTSQRADVTAPVPTSADTRRYMARSAALFGQVQGTSNMAGEGHALCGGDLPLFQDVAWCGGDFMLAAPAAAPLPTAAPALGPAGISLPPARSASPLAAPMRTGSPLRLGVFDDGSVARAGSPLAWSHHASSALLC
ncbi:hypothetical protein FBU31_006394 [Coemansia sp. 'formosensis']|nr:hypothetical protein FBU31_006394 [Coemansia sp. 'formosensis']